MLSQSPHPGISHVTPEQQSIRDALDESQQLDWKDDSIRIICGSRVPNSPAYGVTFSEYKLKRSQYTSSDDEERVRLVFRMPDLFTMLSADMAIPHRISHYRFIVLALELGLIHLQKDYHEKIERVRSIRQGMAEMLVDEKASKIYMQMKKQNISMIVKTRSDTCLTPTVPEWLGNSVKDTATYLNMTTSDFAWLCWCIGVSKTVQQIPPYLKSEIEKTILHFDHEFEMYTDRIDYLFSLINKD